VNGTHNFLVIKTNISTTVFVVEFVDFENPILLQAINGEKEYFRSLIKIIR
jgi:hypothetical protein